MRIISIIFLLLITSATVAADGAFFLPLLCPTKSLMEDVISAAKSSRPIPRTAEVSCFPARTGMIFDVIQTDGDVAEVEIDEMGDNFRVRKLGRFWLEAGLLRRFTTQR